MGKTSFNSMKELSKKLHKKLKKFEEGKMSVHELEELVDDARELHEKLLILKYKAYEKYGQPTLEDKEEESNSDSETQQRSGVNDDVAEEPTVKKDEAVDTEESSVEESFDFSGITEDTSNEMEQPAFDFTAVEDDSEESAEVEENELKESAEIKTSAHFSESTEEEKSDKSIEEPAEVSEAIKDSHVEKLEAEDEESLNQKLKVEDDKLSLRKKLQSTPVKDLKDEISIAKKFEYITFMFGGNNNNYEEAINVLNNCEDAEEAKNKLNEYSSKYDWDLENKSIIKFVELVERRYL